MKPSTDLRTAIIAFAILEGTALGAFVFLVLWN